MKDLMMRALDRAQHRGAVYADIRVTDSAVERVATKNGAVDKLKLEETSGFGVRVLADGAWGFASSRDLTAEEIDRVTDLALSIARASSLVRTSPVEIGPPVTSQGKYSTPFKIDPFSVSLEDKISLLFAADANMARVEGIRVREGKLAAVRHHKLFASTEQAFTEQTITEVGGFLMATAVGQGEIQRRSYPDRRYQVSGGWEVIQGWDFPANAERIATEAVQLLTADPCPRDITTTLIIGSAQLALQVHESCGHPIELDRVMGTEAAYAGMSFLTTEKLNNFRYGSEVINLTAEAIRPNGLGTFGWDDEGVPAQSTPIVRKGMFMGYLTSRETAVKLDQQSNGSMRASGWNRIPLIRMTNVSLEPGTWAFEDLIADTDDGIYIENNHSWSIDDRRYNFQFGTEIGYEIKNGKLGRMLRNCTYTGITPEFWGSADAVCSQAHWTMWGTPNCGKGEPSQIMATGHGAAPTRFRNVHVGVI